MSTDNERRAFDRWVKKRHGCSTERWADSGEYRYDDTRRWWECWRAALDEPAGSVGGDVMAYAVFARSHEHPKPVMIKEYVGSMDVVRSRVMEKARKEGFDGDFVTRMEELGWWLEPLYTHHAPPVVDDGKIAIRESSLRQCIRELNGARNGDNAEQRSDIVHGILTAALAQPQGLEAVKARQSHYRKYEDVVTCFRRGTS